MPSAKPLEPSVPSSRPALLILLLGALGAADFDLAAALRSARAGTAVQVPAGTWRAAGVEIPAGVALRGAGQAATILAAQGAANALVVRGAGVALADFAVVGAGEAGVLVQGASGTTLARLALRDCLSGVLGSGASGLRLENCILAGNRRGAVLSGCSATVLVNCTLAGNAVLGVAVSGGREVAIFNNVFTGSPAAVWLGQGIPGLVLDANLYATSVVGTLSGEPPRASLFGWRRLTGWDAHAVDLPVDYADAAGGDYHPTSRSAWDPSRATTSGWGLAGLAGAPAPASDLDGRPRQGRIDLGAYQSSFPAPRPPDGSFEVAADAALSSAALYHADGRMLCELFQNLPLSPGRHAFTVPARDQSNRPIAAGDYELRTVGSALVNRYRGLAGNFARSSALADNCSWPEEMVAFDRQDRVYILQNSLENGQGVRAFDAGGTQPRWTMPGGGGTVGWAADDRWLYYLQARGGGRFVLRKIDLASGVMGEIAPGTYSLEVAGSARLRGLALLNDMLYLSDPESGTVLRGAAAQPVFSRLASLPGAVSVTADERAGRLWLVAADGALVALDPADGRVLGRSRPVPGVEAISARNGRLAALSRETGKVHVLDIADPAAPQQLRSIGSGDGPGGPQQPDRFWFQRGGGLPIGGGRCSVSINGAGAVAVVDGPRLTSWGADGRLLRQGLGFWGQHIYAARFAPDEDVRLFDISGAYAMRMDCRSGTWKPDGAWELPRYLFEERVLRHVFAAAGKRFALLAVTLGDPARGAGQQVAIAGFDAAKQGFPGYLTVRLDERRMVPVELAYNHPQRGCQVACHDLDGDGVIGGEEGLAEVRRPDGQALLIPGARYGALPWSEGGDLCFAGAQGGEAACARIVALRGLDPSGTWPVYDWAGARPVKALGADGGQPDLLSPYDHTTVERLTQTFQIAPFASGGYVQSAILASSGGTGLANGAGTDLAGFGGDGRLRWLFRLAHREGSEGVQSLPALGLAFAMTSKECDYMVVDEDGLGLGALAMPPEAHWLGMWSDHAQQQVVWLGNDGNPNYVLGDYALNGYHWFAIEGTGAIRRTRQPVRLAAAQAAALAALPGLAPYVKATPPATRLRIPHLAAPLAIDGDLAKWRQAGIAPAAVITPETGTGISSPADCSAVLRLAWHGSDLYVQSIVFDDRICLHQPVAQMYQQDGLELAINGFMQGFKYNLARTTDQGQTVFRNRFVQPAFDRLFTPAEVPRSIIVHPDSRTIEERRLVETLYGVDLAASPALVSEFRLPLTAAVGLSGDPGQIPAVGPGTRFHLGCMIDDNDIPGGDAQKYLVWPATYATFGVKELGAEAVLE